MISTIGQRLFCVCSLVCAFLAGCTAPKVQLKTGTELNSTNNGTKATTYVTPEEYQKMTDDEKKHLNAQVGASATVAKWGSSDSTPREVSTESLNKALKKSKE